MDWYKQTAQAVEEQLDSDRHKGLTQEESQRRLKANGFNELKEQDKPSALSIFLSQFKDFMIYVLFAAILLSAFLGEYLDAVAIFLIVIMNGILGYIQEQRAEKSLDALRELSAPHSLVLREGKWMNIPAKELVVGDIVKVESGDRIGADLRFFSASNLHVEESALTGESVPSQKQSEPIHGDDLPLGDQSNRGFMGTMVTQGTGVGIVTETGMDTEMGKIAGLIQSAEKLSTPLQMKLEQLGRTLIYLSIGLTVLVVLLGVYRGHELTHMILSGVSLAVAAIPEGLPAIVTIALALGVQKMIRRHAIVRKLPAVETLGSATVICSDKTGTLTQNKMTVTHLWTDGKTWDVPEDPKVDRFKKDGRPMHIENETTLKQLLEYAVLCNDAVIDQEDGDKPTQLGDPTEIALLESGKKAGITKQGLSPSYKIVQTFPFDSSRKMMSVIVEKPSGEQFAVVKGAPDVLLSRCDYIMWNGTRELKRSKHTNAIEEAIDQLGRKALRNIAVAYKPIYQSKPSSEADQVEKGLTFVGLQGMIDPPRPEVKKAIAECREAGIKTVMITGDHAVTASAIARQLDLLPAHGKVMDGAALSALTEDELVNQVEDIYVYARVSPEHKLKIVKALQKKGHVVAMTGDGVNDAPAIKSANIGIAMGNTGTDVAKEAAALVLSDDNFSSIKAAVEEGRNIYENIRKFIRYLLASNVGEILVMLIAMMLALPLPLLPIQILWVNLVTDGLPAMALGVDQAEDNVMKRGPRPTNEGVFARGLGWKIISRGFLIGVATTAAFWITLNGDPDDLLKAQSVAFVTLVMAQLIHVFDCRSERSIFDRNPFENRYLVLAVFSSILLMLVVMYVPVLQPVFHTVPLTVRDWLLVLGLAAIPTFLLSGNQLFKKDKRTTASRVSSH
ncbi:cation-translocating P-type ATPase [Pullulanibacillus sp. KACC 23026]|uniref:cation-translocating P-type ATPase n=1 Tax=Pullulanibacillus sp. KACC 23026 TaxID=3028315 RepID=UPI0023B1D614|nr:cation-translocating P-type ATPase [Pullulanibacillus sp. KACC 23026]WEG10895.1 cation-translocating P-type ATPase [Pullulanibacillus sp. KACC 23026]